MIFYEKLPEEFYYKDIVDKYMTETNVRLDRINERLDMIDKLESDNHEFNTKLTEVLLNLLKRVENIESKLEALND